jgi:O-antigen/teichoic acid export membrane protein
MTTVVSMAASDSLTEELLGTGTHDEVAALVASVDRRGRHRRSFPRPLRAVASRQRVMAVTVADQAASSASNFAVAFLVAHYSDAHALGIFAIVSTTYILTQGLVRSLTSDCLLTRHDADDAVMAVYERSGFLSALVCAGAASVLMLCLAAVFSSELRITFVVLALAFPLMAAQDYGRYVGISRYNPAYAVWLDVGWLVLFIVAYEVLRHQGLVSLPWVWAAYCGTGAAVGLYAVRNHLSPRHMARQIAFWFRSERAVGLRFAGQWMLASSWAYVAIYLFVLIFSVAVIGQFKLAQVAFGPVTVLSQGIVTGMVAMAARHFQVDQRKTLRFVMLGGLATAVVMLAWAAAVYFFPVHAMTKALGPAWPAARRLVPLMGLAFALNGVASAAVAGLRSLRAAKENLRLALAMVPVLAACSLVGGVVWGVQAAIAGICLGYGLYALAGWSLLVRSAHRLAPGAGDDGPDVAPPLDPDEPDDVGEVAIEAAGAGI